MAAPECDKFGEDLSAYLDGELPQQRAAELEQHLLGCDSCRGTFEQLRNVAERLAELPHVRAPDELTAAMRRAAERQVLLEVRTPRSKARVWKLFARVSASAALIAACMFAGWQVYERMQEPSPSPTAERLVSVAEGETPLRESFAKDVRSAAPAEAEPLRQPTRAAKPTAPVFALADKTKGVEAGVSVEAHLGVSAGEPVALSALEDVPAVAAGSAPPAAESPTIDIFVAPQTADQYRAALHTITALQQTTHLGEELEEHAQRERLAYTVPADLPTAKVRPADGAEAVARREVLLQVGPRQLNKVIERLEQQAPRQVLVRWADVQRVQQTAQLDVPAAEVESPLEPDAGLRAEAAGEPAGLDRLAGRRGADEPGRPVAAPPADAEEEGQPLARGRFGAGAEVRRVATAKRLTPRSPAGKQEAMEERRGRGRGGEPPAPARAAKRDEKVATAQRGGVVARIPAAQPTLRGGRLGGVAGEGEGKQAREQAVEAIAAPASPPPPAAQQPATQPVQAEQLRAAVVKVRDQLGEFLLGAFMRAAVEPAPPSVPPPARPVTVRVMLLPPPQAQATQPATQPVPQP